MTKNLDEARKNIDDVKETAKRKKIARPIIGAVVRSYTDEDITFYDPEIKKIADKESREIKGSYSLEENLDSKPFVAFRAGVNGYKEQNVSGVFHSDLKQRVSVDEIDSMVVDRGVSKYKESDRKAMQEFIINSKTKSTGGY